MTGSSNADLKILDLLVVFALYKRALVLCNFAQELRGLFVALGRLGYAAKRVEHALKRVLRRKERARCTLMCDDAYLAGTFACEVARKRWQRALDPL
jgi:hypothetical protein